jgi:hypothetical protein
MTAHIFLPPPLRGRAGVGGPVGEAAKGRAVSRVGRPPTLTLPHKGGGEQMLMGEKTLSPTRGDGNRC